MPFFWCVAGSIEQQACQIRKMENEADMGLGMRVRLSMIVNAVFHDAAEFTAKMQNLQSTPVPVKDPILQNAVLSHHVGGSGLYGNTCNLCISLSRTSEEA